MNQTALYRDGRNSGLREPSPNAHGGASPRPASRIRVLSKNERVQKSRLLEVLENVVCAEFGFSSEEVHGAVGELVLLDGDQRATESSPPVSSLVVNGLGLSADRSRPVEMTVKFADDEAVPFPFRGRSLKSKGCVGPRPLSPQPDERVLATIDGSPVWVVSHCGPVKRFRSAFPVPALGADESLYQVFCGERFIEMLPVVHWLREIGAFSSFQPPPLRASFIFDDPNLHWPRYGHVDFRQVVEHARKHDYHVGFATIPLDAWFTHKSTAEIFRKNPERVSLLVHGNNHTKEELAQRRTPIERISLLSQALQRIEALERASGCRVCRVMVPPHGACLEELLADMPALGFESACISHGSLRAHNPTANWRPGLGLRPAEVIRGCPVLPRWGMGGDIFNTILLAAYCRQPIVVRGHHQDLRDGIERLDEIAGFVNSLGPVAWGDMTSVARYSYDSLEAGPNYRIKPRGVHLAIRLPQGAETLTIERPESGTWTDWTISSASGVKLETRVGEPVSVKPATREELLVRARIEPPTLRPVERRAPLTAVTRRILTEARDRFFP